MVPVTTNPVTLFGAPQPGPVSSIGLNPGVGAAAFGSTPSVPAPGIGSAASGGAPPAPFADLITDAIGQVQALEASAKSSIEGLISGQGVDVHEAMIAAQKAGMGFELVLSVRNKALAAYQQVLGMQF